MEEIISRKEAQASNSKYYYTGVPCKRGHVDIRLTSAGDCTICHKNRNDAYKSKNRKAMREYNKKYYSDNNDKCRKLSSEWKRKNPLNGFTRKTLSRLEEYSNVKHYEVMLGYTQEEFVRHIEDQFIDGMSWGNRSDWHIDHIKPISLFLKEGCYDVKIINALSNLQPLWARDNISKGAKYEDIAN